MFKEGVIVWYDIQVFRMRGNDILYPERMPLTHNRPEISLELIGTYRAGGIERRAAVAKAWFECGYRLDWLPRLKYYNAPRLGRLPYANQAELEDTLQPCFGEDSEEWVLNGPGMWYFLVAAYHYTISYD